MSHAPASRRAIVCFVEENRHLIQQLLALRLSWLDVQSPDTDLVVMGPPELLDRLPDDLVKIPQRPAADDPVWRDYRYVNSIACLNGPGAGRLNDYTHLLRTDADTFILPGWNSFYPETFIWGRGAYAHDDDVRSKIQAISAEYGLVHRGHTNVGSTWYGPTADVRRAAAFSEMLTKHIYTDVFDADEGQWPGWYRDVATMYAGEIAVNHSVPDGRLSMALDVHSALRDPITNLPHVHCWPTYEMFSKHAFMAGRYTDRDLESLDPSTVAGYCMATSFRSLQDLARLAGP